MSYELDIIPTQERCMHLLSKGLYLNAGLAPGEEVTGEGDFWCAHTQHTYGPDEELCDRETCRNNPSRDCFELL